MQQQLQTWVLPGNSPSKKWARCTVKTIRRPPGVPAVILSFGDSGQRFHSQTQSIAVILPGSRRAGEKGKEMIALRLAVPAVLAAAIVAGCFTYFVAPPAQVEANQRLQPAVPKLTGSATRTSTSIDQRPHQEEKAAAAFQQAAEAILRRAANARASADIDQPSITGKIPLPKRRPITLP